MSMKIIKYMKLLNQSVTTFVCDSEYIFSYQTTIFYVTDTGEDAFTSWFGIQVCYRYLSH